VSVARNILLNNKKEIINWIDVKNQSLKSDLNLLYSSVDVRESSFKVAPVDINLFPSGFNNFASAKYLKRLSCAFTDILRGRKKVGLLVENFTRNKNYTENVEILKQALELQGVEVFLMTIDAGKVIALDNNFTLDDLDLIILNNDLSSGYPEELMKVRQKIFPSPEFGWHSRKKHVHLGIYNDLINEIVSDLKLDIDPWLLSTFIDRYEGIDFKNKIGIEKVAEKVEKMISKIKEKYREHKMRYEPHVFIKANNGTFGMGVMVAYSGDDVLNINKKYRHSMNSIKNGLDNNDVIIQEGIQTLKKFRDLPCEDMLYCFEENILSKFVRYNVKKSNQQNLNSVGMEIEVIENFDDSDIIISKLVHLTMKLESKILSKNQE
jgi:glutamate--cysteine ligase